MFRLGAGVYFCQECIMSKSCKKCTYFKLTNGELGKCRKNAPVIVQCQDGEWQDGFTRWPEVSSSDFCGDYLNTEYRPY